MQFAGMQLNWNSASECLFGIQNTSKLGDIFCKTLFNFGQILHTHITKYILTGAYADRLSDIDYRQRWWWGKFVSSLFLASSSSRWETRIQVTPFSDSWVIW